MSRNKQNRIDFYNMLVSSSEQDFHDWCEELITEEEYLEKRSFLILDFYSAFNAIYNYFKKSFISDDISKFFCEFNKENTEMTIVVKYESYKIEESFLEEINEYFAITDDSDYDSFKVVYDHNKDKTLKLIFSKG